MKFKLLSLLLILAFVFAACSPDTPPPDPDPDPGQDPGIADPDPEPDPEPFDFSLYRPNELGEIPIWMYHNIKEPESTWVRTPDNFRADLQRFYDLGYRLVSLTDVIANNIDIPAGTSPMVLTFDDGNANNFNLLKDERGEIVVDPDCAVGIILDFAEKHPDMGTAATFFVHLPHPFSQKDSWYTSEHRTWKLQKLVEWGMEIGNHSLRHPHLSKDIKSLDHLLEELGKPQQLIEELVPGYRLNSLALPYGSKPKAEWRDYLHKGQFQGVEYQHDAVLLVGSTPAKPYNHVGYSPLAMPRVRASNYPDGGVGDFLDKALARLNKTRYISDGDPDIITVPESALEDLNPESLGDKELRTYNLEATE
ncbi:MAG: polysaccharide deacetylase family protein [Bacillota bacterium]